MEAIKADEHGLWLGSPPTESGILWHEISRIEASSFGYGDQPPIVMLTFFDEADNPIEVATQLDGFAEAMEVVAVHLPELADDWAMQLKLIEPRRDPIVLMERNLPPRETWPSYHVNAFGGRATIVRCLVEFIDDPGKTSPKCVLSNVAFSLEEARAIVQRDEHEARTKYRAAGWRIRDAGNHSIIDQGRFL